MIGFFVGKARSGVRIFRVIHCEPVTAHTRHSECPLPSLSQLLENPRIKETDSMVLCIQIHSPAGPSIPQHPSVYYVPRDLLDGLEASLDNPSMSNFSL